MTSVPLRFEEVEHVADAALRIYGGDWEDFLINAALGMFSLIADWEDAAVSTESKISLRSTDSESLLVDWLSELLYLHEMGDVVYIDFDIVDSSPSTLRAVARGTDQWTHRTAIKAVTFNDLSIAKTPEGYTATIVFDT